MILHGLLVDMVPWNKAFDERDNHWENGIAEYWANGGERQVVSHAQTERGAQEWREQRAKGQVSGLGFGIQTKDGKPIGSMGINFMSPYHRIANLGAVIGEPDYWGGGYGTDALTLLLDYCFDWLDLRRVWLDTMVINVRVQRQMDKLGFKLEGHIRRETFVDGQWVDMLVYGLLREEWPGREAVIERIGLSERSRSNHAEE
ncbi:MAG TPA: GNAT family protein [Aggregatilineaceae bacterium]|nr:GNAT family protein [Aggregatilineaceae bacterium]